MKRKRNPLYPDINDPLYNKKQRVGDKLITYTNGFCSILTRNITKGNFVDLLDDLKKEFKKRYKAQFKFVPEQICEGGVLWQFWDGKRKHHYKTLRLRGVLSNNYKNEWPWIKDDTLSKWKNNNDVLFYRTWVDGYPKYNHKFYTFTKAFYGAPVWTKQEIMIFIKVFQYYGFKPSRYAFIKNYPIETQEDTKRYQYMKVPILSLDKVKNHFSDVSFTFGSLTNKYKQCDFSGNNLLVHNVVSIKKEWLSNEYEQYDGMNYDEVVDKVKNILKKTVYFVLNFQNPSYAFRRDSHNGLGPFWDLLSLTKGKSNLNKFHLIKTKIGKSNHKKSKKVKFYKIWWEVHEKLDYIQSLPKHTFRE